MTHHAILFAPLVLAGCVHCGPPEPVPTEQPGDCSAACDNLRSLGCPEGEPAPGPEGEPGAGASCEEVCRNTAEYGISLDAACVRRITSCEALEQCSGDSP